MLINDNSVPVATEADLVSTSKFLLQTPSGTKQLPGDCVAPKSVQDNLRAVSDPKIGVATELTHVVRASGNLSITYTPTVNDSKYFFLRKFAYGSNTTFTIYANDSTGVHSQQTFKSNVPFDSIVELELPTGYDRWIFYRGTTESPFDVALYNISEGAIDKDIETIFNDLSQNPTYDTLWTFSIADNARLDTQKKLSVSSLDLLVEIGEDYEQQYNVFFKDSTSVNPTLTPAKYYNVGTLYHIDLPTGYDTIALYNSVKNTSGSAVSGTAKALSEMSLGYKLSIVQNEIKTLSDSFNTEINGGTVGLEFAIPNGQRLDVARKYNSSSVEFCLDIDENYYDTFNVYFKDSTGVNSPNTSNTRSYNAGNFYHIDIPTGYDSLWFFKSTYNTSGNTSYCFVIDTKKSTLDYRVTALESNIDNNFLKGKKVVCIGDSITQFTYQGMGYVKYLADMTGANSINAGVGGTRYAPRAASSPSPSSVDQAYANLDIYNRVHAWCTDEWTDIDAAVAYMITQGVNYSSYINALKNNPLIGVDVVTLFAGTNDFASGVALGDINSTDTSKTLGALNKIIEELLSVNGKLKIFVFTPTIRYINNNRTDPYYSDNWQNSQGITLKEEAAKIEECARANHIPVCDFYNTLGWNKWNFSSYFTDNEGTHPEKGYDSIARRMSGFIISNAW